MENSIFVFSFDVHEIYYGINLTYVFVNGGLALAMFFVDLGRGEAVYFEWIYTSSQCGGR